MRKILLITVLGLLLAHSEAFARGSIGRAAYAAHNSKDDDFKIIALVIIALAIVVRIIGGFIGVVGGIASAFKSPANPYSDDDRAIVPSDRSATNDNQELLSLDDDPPLAHDRDPHWDAFVREVDRQHQRP